MPQPKYDLIAIDDFDRPGLMAVWADIMKTPVPPNISKEMLRLSLAWELQATQSKQSVKRLDRTLRPLLKANAPQTDKPRKSPNPNRPISLSLGTRLSREWNGRTYAVDVVDQGFVYNSKVYKTLSPIAYAITGSKRSGPHFFGVDR